MGQTVTAHAKSLFTERHSSNSSVCLNEGEVLEDCIAGVHQRISKLREKVVFPRNGHPAKNNYEASLCALEA